MIQRKICMLGAYGVGKTSLVRRFVESIFDERYQTTVGVKIDKKVVESDGVSVMLMIWDLAGEDEVEQIRMSHLRGTAGYILVADGCRQSTFSLAMELRARVGSVCGDIPFVLAVNKADLRDEWEVDPADPAMSDPTAVFVTSAKTGASVQQMFEALASRMLKSS